MDSLEQRVEALEKRVTELDETVKFLLEKRLDAIVKEQLAEIEARFRPKPQPEKREPTADERSQLAQDWLSRSSSTVQIGR